MTTKGKIAIGGALVLGAAALWWWKKSKGGTRPVCGPGYEWHAATPTELSMLSQWSLPMQEMLRKWGGYCGKAGTVGDVEVIAGPITQPWQVE